MTSYCLQIEFKILIINLLWRWAWQPIFLSSFICAGYKVTCMPNLVSLALIVTEI